MAQADRFDGRPYAQGPQRVVRQDGHYLWAKVSNLSLRGCQLNCELPFGEIVSVEIPNVALLVGEVQSITAGKSAINFFGATRH